MEKLLRTLFVSPVRMMPLASSRISPGSSLPVAHAAWCGNRRLIRTRPGYGAVESTPPDTDSPKPRGPLIISTVKVQSGSREGETNLNSMNETAQFCRDTIGEMDETKDCLEWGMGSWKDCNVSACFRLDQIGEWGCYVNDSGRSRKLGRRKL